MILNRKQTVYADKIMTSLYWKDRRILSYWNSVIAIEYPVGQQSVQVKLFCNTRNPKNWWWKVGTFYIHFRFPGRVIEEWLNLIRAARAVEKKNAK